MAEIGWPSNRDKNEAKANLQNAQDNKANHNKRLASRAKTRMRSEIHMEAYIFVLINEDSQPGIGLKIHYGLFLPNGVKTYDFRLKLNYSRSSKLYTISSSSTSHKILYYKEIFFTLFMLIVTHIVGVGKKLCAI